MVSPSAPDDAGPKLAWLASKADLDAYVQHCVD
jgi:hypothetical protein